MGKRRRTQRVYGGYYNTALSTKYGNVSIQNKKKRFKRKLSLRRQVRNLVRKVYKPESVTTYKEIKSGALSHSKNELNRSEIILFKPADVEAAIGQMQVVSPGHASEYEGFDGSSITKTVSFKICYSSYQVVFRNNNLLPIVAKFYECCSKGNNTAQTILSDISDGLSNKGVSAPTTDLRYHPHNSALFKKNNKVLGIRKKIMNPGETFVYKGSAGKFSYDPEMLDQNSGMNYIPWKTRSLIVETHGVVAHDDTTTTTVGLCEGQLDYVCYQTICIQHKVNEGLKTIGNGVSTLGTMTQSVVMGHDVEQNVHAP